MDSMDVLPASLTVTVCGGGNGAHVAAGYLASKPALKVNVLTRRPDEWSRSIKIVTKGSSWESKGTINGTLHTVTDDPSAVIPDSDLVIVAAPAHTHPPILHKIAPHISRTRRTLLGALYAQGGFDWAARAAIGDLTRVEALFGLQNIPWICKKTVYGREARILGPKKNLWVASCPVEKSRTVACLMSLLFDIPTGTVPNFLTLTLTPSNQIIHPARYYGIFNEWDGRRVYGRDEIPWGLYSDMDDLSAMWLDRLDQELQAVKHRLLGHFPALDLSLVLPLGERVIRQYGSDVSDRSSLKMIFVSNRGYQGCVTPTKCLHDGAGKVLGYLPDVDSRLFWEDIPYGLCVLKGIAEMLGVSTPAVDAMIEWHQKWMGKQFILGHKLNPATVKDTAAPPAYGMSSLVDLVSSSLPQHHQEQHTAVLQTRLSEGIGEGQAINGGVAAMSRLMRF
ncbi:unnamed protein product [Vitrella brassicaformis CCMP3155]|uniref:Opine dehydrogenase domain-containing protein n=2 Tax=Vitrella brassicaformis TaxID=1169539 RepID=A0A0G4EGP2_VITBC|nr:unnamed protein product [Vitrella brassicaformis CCMP3155]|eukprot:CEL95619.1 unnamed protein product [Vitrella brassicaformis CCMP3155]